MIEAQQPPVTHIQTAPEYGDTALQELEDLGITFTESKPRDLEQRDAVTENKIDDISFTVKPNEEESRNLTDEPINNPVITFEVSRMPGESGLIVVHFESEENPEDTSFDIWFRDGEAMFDGKVDGNSDWAGSNDSSITSRSKIQIEVVNYSFYNQRTKKTEQRHQILVGLVVNIDGEEEVLSTIQRNVTNLPNDFNVSIVVENNGTRNFSTEISDITLGSSTRRGAR